MKTGAWGKDDVEIVSRESVYQGFFRMEVVNFRHRLFRGGMSPVIKREVLSRPSAVAVLIFDPQRDEILFIEQFRIGALDEQPWQLEIVAGLLDSSDGLEATARREAMEEAGVKLGRMEKIVEFITTPGNTNEKLTIFVAEADLSLAGGIYGLAEEGEDIRVVVMTTNHAAQALANGRIGNAPAIIALQWLLLNKTRLLSRWQV